MRSVQFQIESLLDVITFLLQKLDPEEARYFDKRIFASISKQHIDIVNDIESKIKTVVEDAASMHEILDDRDTIGSTCDKATINLIADSKVEFGDEKVTGHGSKIADDLTYVKIHYEADSIDDIDEDTTEKISKIVSCTESNLESEYENIESGHESMIGDDLESLKIQYEADSIENIDEETTEQISNIVSCTESKIADDLDSVKIQFEADSIENIDEETTEQISNIVRCTESNLGSEYENLESPKDQTIEIKEEQEYGEQKQNSLNYKCIFCDIDLGPEFEAMKVHDEELHIKYGFYFCIEGCGYTVKDKRKIVNHFMMKHKPELMTSQCTKCDQKFPSRNIRRKHMEKAHVSVDLLICKICDKKMGHPYSLRIHMEQQHKRKEKLSCHICGKEFINLQKLKDHIECHSITEKSIQCPKCDKKFLTEFKLRVHIGGVHRPLEKMAICSQCDYKAKSASRLRKHMSIHTSERPFSCETCGQQFKTNDILKMHESIHTGERKYICNYCNKAFRTGTNLKTHERIHTSTIQGHCDICEKDFVQRSNYQIHMKKYHPEVLIE